MLGIRATRLFNGVDATPVKQPLVLVEEGKVVAVQSGGQAPAQAEVIDLGDVTLLPGLIDAHVHLAFDAGPDPVGRLATTSDEQLLQGMRRAAATALAAGITTLRDLGDRNYLGVRLRDELAGTGPHLLAAGPPITVPKGHCWFLGGEAEGVQGVQAAVREHAERGADVIKVMATGGELTKGTRSTEVSFTPPELAAIVEQAQRLGLPTTAHAHAAQGIAYVAEAGFDMVEHCSFMTGAGAHADQAMIDLLKRSGIIVGATLGTVPGLAPRTRFQAMVPQFVAVFTRLREEGLTIVCSSDAGIGPAKPHDVLPHAVAMMVEMNAFPLIDALRAVTSVAASALRLGERKGRVAAGFDADLLAVRGDPLHDVHALRAVEAVFAGGRRVR